MYSGDYAIISILFMKKFSVGIIFLSFFNVLKGKKWMHFDLVKSCCPIQIGATFWTPATYTWAALALLGGW